MDTPKPLTHEERQALIRQPITRGILAEHFGTRTGGKSHGGSGERPELPVYNHGRIVGSRARRLGDGATGAAQ